MANHNPNAELMDAADRLLGALADLFLDSATFADFTAHAHAQALTAAKEAADALAAALRKAKEADRG